MGGSQGRGLALCAATALALSACASAGPQNELVAAFDRSFSGSFAYTLHVESETEPPDGGGLGSLARSLELSGRHAADSDALVVRILGLEVFELRSEGPERFHARLGLGELFRLAAGGDVDPSAAIMEVLEGRGASREVLDTVKAGLRGEWLTVEGHLDTAELERILGGGPTPTESEPPGLREVLCRDLLGFVDCFVTVRGAVADGEDRMYQVELDVAGLVRRLGSLDPTAGVVDVGDLPDRIPGTVTTRDGMIRSVTLEFPGSPAGAEGTAVGAVRARLEVRDHGVVEPTAAPEGNLVVSAEEFLEALGALMELTEEIDARP